MSFLSVTGNANFHMTQTSLTLLGFTQPTSALPIISNAQNNSKGFTSRILWYFPEPIYSRLKDLKLTPEERHIADSAENVLGEQPICILLVLPCRGTGH